MNFFILSRKSNRKILPVAFRFFENISRLMMLSNDHLYQALENFESGIRNDLNLTISQVIKELNDSLSNVLKITIESTELIEDSIHKNFIAIKNLLAKGTKIEL